MAKKVEFFKCFSINLHNFLKSSGIKHMNKDIHQSGINVGFPDGTWRSFASTYEAHKATGLPKFDLDEIRDNLLTSQDVNVEFEGYKFSKRVRVFWVYLSDEKLDKALRIWKQTGPKGS